jgi:hypothetical protein
MWELCTLLSFRTAESIGAGVEILFLENDISSSIWSQLLAFDVDDSHCFDPNEELKLKRVIETVGKDRFNRNVRQLASIYHARRLGAGVENSDSTLKESSPALGLEGEGNVDAPERLTLLERQAIMIEVARRGGEDGALYAHSTLSPFYWGISRSQFFDFVALVRSSVQNGSIVNLTPENAPFYSAEKFETVGPNAYQVCNQRIKPLTDASAMVLPLCSYALQQNPAAGQECNLFLSHAWSEGVFELAHTLETAWREEYVGAYVCFLANPQNLDISVLVSTPETSPFYRLLNARPRSMTMAANSNDPIHSRLWCCLEAFCSVEFGIPVEIAGDPMWLVRSDQRESARTAVRVAVSAQHHRYAALGDGIYGMTEVQAATQELHTAFESIAIKSEEAACFSADDRTMILALLGGRTEEIDAMIKNQMVAKADEAVSMALRYASKNETTTVRVAIPGSVEREG